MRMRLDDEEGPLLDGPRRRTGWRHAGVVLVLAASSASCGWLAARSSRSHESMELARRKNRHIAKAYYINCDSSPERREFMESWLAGYGVPYERYACVSGDTVDEVSRNVQNRYESSSLLRQRDLAENTWTLDEPELAHSVGCYASHVALLETVAKLPDRKGVYLLLEDDVQPSVDLATLEAAAQTLPDDWVYAGLNVHDSICLEDVLEHAPLWALRSKLVHGNWAASDHANCTAKRLSYEWRGNDFYFSDAAALVTPANARTVLARYRDQDVKPNDVVLMSPSRDEFPSYVNADQNLFWTRKFLPEARDADRPASSSSP